MCLSCSRKSYSASPGFVTVSVYCFGATGRVCYYNGKPNQSLNEGVLESLGSLTCFLRFRV